MRVLYSFPNVLGAPCAIGVTAWHHVVNLAENRALVTVICPMSVRALPGDCDVTLVKTHPMAGRRVTFRLLARLLPRHGLERWHDRRVASFLLRSAAGFDVVHCWPLGSEQTLATASRLGIPTFLERPNAHTAVAWDEVEAVHADLGIPVDPSDTHVRDAAKLSREEREYALADRILCPSEFVVNSFLSRGFPPGRLKLTGRGFDPAEFHAVGRADNREGPLNACFVGNAGPRKGLHHALTAWFDSGNADAGGKFFVVGRIPPTYIEYLAPLLGHDSVRLLGHVADLAGLMRSCDVFLLPTFEEASAKATYEAKACGCVLLVSDRACDHVTHGVDGFVHLAGDVAQLTSQLRTLKEDRTLIARMREASLESAETLTWSHAGEILIDAYTSSLGHRPGARPGQRLVQNRDY